MIPKMLHAFPVSKKV